VTVDVMPIGYPSNINLVIQHRHRPNLSGNFFISKDGINDVNFGTEDIASKTYTTRKIAKKHW